ncbi:Phosphatidylinositolglycan class N-domain-containing protein [Crucibulum laeve]|uniref:GPI ethanolamine phosphate transferase 1 n=1 Tax=Crucibulum laeve TaxID=68775 RepID=A0A5C3MEZ0_9AGAR|nr:Phosphatidylinositolglycan class N-domain-containing protein [Crucibulum laeve]
MPPKTRYNVAKLLILGLIFHLVFIASVFDCYFISPVVSGMERYSVGAAEAKRLVLIVGDGLRADLLFNKKPFPNIESSPEIIAPYLRSIVEERGAFGISHTRVPTESRPGHVAIIGGMYEDVSAVTKGWKTNPVDFDSVFNQSSTTFSFGSPDILPMFSRGATPGKVKTWSYSSEEEDFTKDATELDTWVLDHLRTLFQNATSNPELNTRLRSDKVVFFLHLLGLDTTGHSYRPHSKEYMYNIQVVDNIVRETEKLISDFYQDEETSYVFTADHGMSAIGNHGDGRTDPDNTRTPLIAWGRGIRKPLPDSQPSSHDAYSKPWGLEKFFRRDVEQADIASLMASLIGIEWPANSVGVLPDVDPTRPGYLDPQLGDQTRAKAAFVNAKVILEHYRVKHDELIEQAKLVFYKPFQSIKDPSHSTEPLRVAHVNTIEQLIASQDWTLARQASAELIKSALAGLHYLQTYDRLLIRAIVTAAYLGWAAFASLYIFRPLDRPDAVRAYPALITTVSLVVLLGFWGLFAAQKSAWTFYVYIAFPCYFWREFLVQATPPTRKWLDTPREVSAYIWMAGKAVAIVCVLQLMVLAYTRRVYWSTGFVLIGGLWPLTWPKGLYKRNELLHLEFLALCIVSSIFPLIPVNQKENIAMIFLGGTVILAIGWFFVTKKGDGNENWKELIYPFCIQASLVVATMFVTSGSVRSLRMKAGLPLLHQVQGWAYLLIASLFPFLYHSKFHTVNSKLLMYFLGFGPCFVILSISTEGLFYAAYSATLAIWIEMEKVHRGERKSSKSVTYEFQPDDLRIALFFLFFVQVGFFGTGNVASISSFYLEPVYRLIPIFNPFFMASLLVFKIIAPYIMLSITFAVLNHTLHLPPFSLLLVALTLTDGMTLAFFFNVQDTGSWLEIGQSITFFCISSLLLLWSAGICAAGEYLMMDVINAKPQETKVE